MTADHALLRAQILLVEDDAGIREALADVLGDCGYQVQCAENGAKALDRLLAGLRPHLILLDLMMPVMDGWQLLRRLEAWADWQRIPVVTVSAARAVCPPGACHSLPKPVDLDALLGTIERFRRPLQAAQAPSANDSSAAAHSASRSATSGASEPWQRAMAPRAVRADLAP